MAAERILVKGVIQVLKLVIPVVAKTVGFTWSLKTDLKKLQDTLEIIHAKIADAEEEKEKNNELRLWLKRLKDVAYDADDVMNDFSYETMRLSESQSFMCKALDFVSSSNPLAYRLKLTKNIKEINKRVDEIAKDMQRFHLQTTFNNTDGESSEQQSRQTASLIIDSEIVGRKDDKNKIVDMLIKESTSSSSSSSSDVNCHSLEKVSVISIVGKGGIGKTALAQLVYNDELVTKHFDQRLWVYVSIDFDVKKVLIEIMESITLANFDNISNFDLLVNKVRETLHGKKFLLVLDDLWNENFQQWETLKYPLLAGAQGSKILITARNMQVADVVKGSIPPYHLGELQEDECWSIIKKKAFSPGGPKETPYMISIGKEIAKKCSGLPLAAKFLGSLMHSKNTDRQWLSIRETDVWNTQEGQSEIRPILKLSYDNLSPQLKQCFSYCSMLPKGFLIFKKFLIQLWMAEGFLGSSSNTVGNARSIEDIGEEYFDSLVWSSFLDVVEKNDLDDIITCKMHDVVHDLGRDVAENRECAIFKISELENIADIRRLFLICDDDLSRRRSEALSQLKKLRTVVIHKPINNMNGYTFSRNEKLRVLHINLTAEGCPGFAYPAAKKLRHLRYFCLSNSNLRNCVLHVSKLYHLQSLVLSGCLHVQDVLRSIGSLKNLRYLEISSSDIKELPESVTSLPNLQTLDLNHCKNFTTFPNSVTGLQHLKHLYLEKTSIEELPGFIINLRNLQTLDVSCCEKLKSLPEYVAGLANLRLFIFGGCPLLEALPKDIGDLTQLRLLVLSGTAIRELPEACGNLHNLEYVNLFECESLVQVKNWTKLRKFHFNRNMVTPTGIGKLDLLQGLSYRVREQVVNEQPECDDGIEELANLSLLEGLAIRDLQNVKDPKDAKRANIKGKQNLRQLELYWYRDKTEEEMIISDQKSCNDLQVCEALEPPSGLKILSIQNFMGRDLPTMIHVPFGLPELYSLRLRNCRGIKQLPESIGKLAHLRILELEGMPLKSLNIGGFPSLIELSLTDMFLLEELGNLYESYPCLQKLWIIGCKSLTEIPFFISLEYMHLENVDPKLVWFVGRSLISSLTTLYLEKIDGLEYFPMTILQNNLGLQFLLIKECNQIHGFREDEDGENVNEFYWIASLRILCLLDCPVLKFLPDLRELTSLVELWISMCPLVKEYLTYDLKSLSFLDVLEIDFIQTPRNDHRRDQYLSDIGVGMNTQLWSQRFSFKAGDSEQRRQFTITYALLCFSFNKVSFGLAVSFCICLYQVFYYDFGSVIEVE